MRDWCKEHPKYEAKRKPGSTCGTCWHLYFLKNPEAKPSAGREEVTRWDG